VTEFFVGIDVGSTMTKVVILGDGITASIIGPTGPEQRRLANRVMEQALHEAGISFPAITYVVSTGYGRINVPFADRQVTEITCHARGVSYLVPQARTVVDVGGQDAKAITVNEKGRPTDFIMNDKCAAGSGRFVEVTADTLGIPLEHVGMLSLQSSHPARISDICTIYAQQEVAAGLAEGVPVPDLLAGIHRSLADRISRMTNRLHIRDVVVLTGGGGKNAGLHKALEIRLGRAITVPEEPLIVGALGAALVGRDAADEAKKSGAALDIKERVLEEVMIF